MFALDSGVSSRALIQMGLRISRASEALIFDLGELPSGFLRLCVSNSSAETMWDLVPVALQTGPVLHADMSFVQLPQGSATDVLRALKEAVARTGGRREQAVTAPSQVLEELTQALKATVLPEQTANAAIHALSQLTQAMSDAGALPAESIAVEARKQTRSQSPRLPPVTKVVYGAVPEGYREIADAQPLVPGQEYRIVLFGEEPFDLACEYFVA